MFSSLHSYFGPANGKFATKSFSLIFISLNATSITTLPSHSNVSSTKRNGKNGFIVPTIKEICVLVIDSYSLTISSQQRVTYIFFLFVVWREIFTRSFCWLKKLIGKVYLKLTYWCVCHPATRFNLIWIQTPKLKLFFE